MILLLCCSFQDTSPAGHFQVGCEHRFVWQTAAACPIQTSKGDGANCTVTNPSTGQWSNLHPPTCTDTETYYFTTRSPHARYTVHTKR